MQPSRSGTPLPAGAPGQKPKLGMGSTSDGEATGGEMSDGARQKKKKLKLLGTGPRGTPTGSRAGSPVPGGGGKLVQNITPRDHPLTRVSSRLTYQPQRPRRISRSIDADRGRGAAAYAATARRPRHQARRAAQGIQRQGRRRTRTDVQGQLHRHGQSEHHLWSGQGDASQGLGGVFATVIRPARTGEPWPFVIIDVVVQSNTAQHDNDGYSGGFRRNK